MKPAEEKKVIQLEQPQTTETCYMLQCWTRERCGACGGSSGGDDRAEQNGSGEELREDVAAVDIMWQNEGKDVVYIARSKMI